MSTVSRIAAIERATKRSWDEWLAIMETIDAQNLSHHEIATHLLYELDGKIDNHAWWAQSITVAYEQAIGRRIPGQQSSGTFQMSVSKSTKLDMQTLMDQWSHFASVDASVQGLIASEVRVSGTEKRITWRTKGTDGSDIRVTSEPKKNGTASIIATQMGIKTEEGNLAAKSIWARILERFVNTL